MPRSKSDPAPAEQHVLLVEPNANGHRLHYVRLLIQECVRANITVTVLTTDSAMEHENWSLHLADIAGQFFVIAAPGDTYAAASRVSRSVGAVRTVIPDGDSFLPVILRGGWRGEGQLSMLIMRADVSSGGSLARFTRTAAKRAAIIAAGRRPNVDVFVLRSPLTKKRGPLRWVADPVVLEASENGRKQVEELMAPFAMRAWVGVFGRVTTRKNLPLILRALESAPRGTGLLIGGTIDLEVEAEVSAQLARLEESGSVVLRLTAPVTDEMLDSAISMVDCVVAAHSNEGPSGIVAKAAASGRKLVLAGAHSLRADADALGAQAEWTELSVDSLSAAIARALTRANTPSRLSLGSEEFTTFLVPELVAKPPMPHDSTPRRAES